METKRCVMCKKVKPITEYYLDAITKSGIKGQCKECYLRYERNKRRDNPKHIQLRDRNYMAKYNRTVIGKFYQLKSNSKQTGISFDISKDEFIVWFNATPKICHYCQSQLTPANGRKFELTGLTIDRKDNTSGYTLNNIVLSCRRCNFAKGSWFSETQMLEIANKYFVH